MVQLGDAVMTLCIYWHKTTGDHLLNLARRWVTLSSNKVVAFLELYFWCILHSKKRPDTGLKITVGHTTMSDQTKKIPDILSGGKSSKQN